VKFAEAFRIAVRALTANKVRSALTMLGVIIGVAAVILLVAIGTGVQGEITGTIKGLGSNLLFVFQRGRRRLRRSSSGRQALQVERREAAPVPAHRSGCGRTHGHWQRHRARR
jgi:ABC-type lipoprotein release transport system permease subunit